MDLKSLKIERKPTQKRRRKNPWPARLAVLGVLGAGVWLTWPMLTQFYDKMRLPSVRTYRVTEAAPAAAAAVRGTAANGYIVAARRAALSSDVPGRIVELNVQEGSVVKEGDIVARLFAEDFRAAYLRSEADVLAAATAVKRAEAALEAARADWKQSDSATANAEALRDEGLARLAFAEQELVRAKDLQQSGIEGIRRQQQATSDRDQAKARLRALVAGVTATEATGTAAEKRVEVARIDIDASKARYAASEAARDLAKATLDKTDVRAPFDGVVVLKDAEVGEVVSPNAQGGSTARGAVCTMVDFNSLEVQANVPENTLSSVRVGAPAEVYLDAFPDDRYAGTVDRIWPTADRQKATVEVRIKLAKRDERLRPEMGVRIVFRRAGEPEPSDQADSSRRIVVPIEAIVQIDGRDGAFVVKRGTVRFTEVSVGERKSGRVAIEAGLSTDQQIVLDPPDALKDGDRILIAEK